MVGSTNSVNSTKTPTRDEERPLRTTSTEDSEPTTERALPPWARWGLLAAIVLGALLRFLYVGTNSLWHDEGATYAVVRESGAWFWQLALIEEGNMSLYFILLRGLVVLFGDSETVLRSLSIVCGVLGIGAVYAFGRRLVGKDSALLGAAIFAVHTANVSFSQDARSYALLVLFFVWSSHAFSCGIEQPTRTRYWVLYLLTSAVAIHAHLMAPFMLFGQWLTLTRDDWRALGRGRALGLLAALGVLLLPIAAFFFVGRPNEQPLQWSLEMRLFFGFGIIAFLLPIVLSGGNPIWFGLAARGAVRAVRNRKKRAAPRSRARSLAILFWGPAIAVFFAYFPRTMPNPSYGSVMLPGVALWLGRELTPDGDATRTRSRRGVVTALGLATSLVLSFLFVARGANFRGEWREAVEYVLARRQPGDAIFFYHTSGIDLYDYYVTRVPSHATDVELPQVIFPGPNQLGAGHWEPEPGALSERIAQHPRVWVVLFQKKRSDLDATLFADCTFTDEHMITKMVDLTVSRCDRVPAPSPR